MVRKNTIFDNFQDNIKTELRTEVLVLAFELLNAEVDQAIIKILACSKPREEPKRKKSQCISSRLIEARLVNIFVCIQSMDAGTGKILTTQMCISCCRFHLKHSLVESEERNVESATSQIKNEHRTFAFGAFVEAVC